MSNGTPLDAVKEMEERIGRFAGLAGVVTKNLPRDLEKQLELDFAANGAAVRMLLTETLTRANLDRVLIALGKKPNPELLLTHVGTIAIPAYTPEVECLTVNYALTVNTAENAPIKISYVSKNIRDWFGDLVVRASAASTFCYGDLTRNSLDLPIIAGLGGEAQAESSFVEVIALMGAQKNGQAGPLLTNGHANIFYIRDPTGVLRAVSVLWDGGGWSVGANSVSSPSPWHAGSRVFSRNSCGSSDSPNLGISAL